MIAANTPLRSPLLGAASSLRRALEDFEPERYSAPDCAAIADELVQTAKACQAAGLLAASRAAQVGAHRDQGFAEPAAWVAASGGTTTRQAKEELDTVRGLDACPQTREALLAGFVSLAQAHEITKAEADSPGQEAELVGIARRADLSKLRDEIRDRTLSRTRPEDLHLKQLAARRFRHWMDSLGMVRFDGALPPESGIPLVNRLERRAAQLRRAASPERHERFEAHAADALVDLLEEGRSRGGRPPTELVIVCDLYAWRRGHAHTGEPCHVIGGGPIPVTLAKELAEDAFVKGVLHDGVAIQHVSHPGRRFTAKLRTAIDLGPVPTFSGRACVDCGRRYGLQNDHVDPIANDGPTSYENVKPRCYPHHAEKTERDRKEGLLGSRARGRPSTETGLFSRSAAPEAPIEHVQPTAPPGRDPP